MKFLEKVAAWVLNVTLFALVGVGVLIVGSILPIFGTHRVFVVQSGSMEPALRTGSVIFIQPKNSYGVGDIVTWQPTGGGTPITHRIVKEFPGADGIRFQTKGDANESEDAAISERQILGSVALHVPFLGYPVSFAKKPAGFVLLILIPALLIIFDELLNLKREFAKRAYEKRRRNQTNPSPGSPGLISPVRVPGAEQVGSSDFLSASAGRPTKKVRMV